MSEITSDYRPNDNVHRYGPINAKASELSGSGTIADEYGWLIDENSLPDELIDSDESTSEASGGGTIRFSTDEFGANQLDITVEVFTPASGGAGGGAEAAIWLDIGSYEGGTAKPVYVWWITGGSQTQTGTAFNAHTVAHNATSNPTGSAGDVPDDSAAGNDGDTLGSMAALTTGPGSIKKEWPFDGTNDEIEFGQFDVESNIFFEFWLNATNTTTRRAIVGKHNSGGSNLVVLLFWETGALTSIVGTSVQTSGTSNTGDTHWIIQFEESGSDTIVRWYKDGALHHTQTHTGAVIGLVSGLQEWRWGQEWDLGTRSDFWLGSMAAMRLVEGAVSNLADIAATHYSNQNDASNFWDTASASYEAGPFNAIPVYRINAIGNNRTWEIDIHETGYSGDTTTICSGREIKATWGRQTNDFDSRIRAAEMEIDIYDPSFAVYNYLSDTTKQESDFYIEATDSSGTYTLRMKIRLDELETMLVDNLRTQITRVYCYCGMAEMKTIDAVTATSMSFGDLFGKILISNGISQDIEYVSQHWPKNIAATGVVYDLMRLNRLDLIFIEDGRKKHNMYDQLKGLLEGFGLTAFTGMDGQWHVKHEYALGDTLTGKRGTMKYDVNAGTLTTLNTVTGRSFSLVNALVNDTAMKRPLKPVQAVEVSRGNPSGKFITVDMVRFGDFEEGWVSATEHIDWDLDSASRTTESDTGTYAIHLDPESEAVQELPRVAGGQNIDLEVAVNLAFRESSGAAGLAGRDLHVTIGYFTRGKGTDNSNQTVVAYDTNGGWAEYPEEIDTPPKLRSIPEIQLSTTSVGAASTLIYSAAVTTLRGPLPNIDGFLYVSLVGDKDSTATPNYETYVDNVEVRFKSGDEGRSDFIGVTALFDDDNELIPDGAIVEQRVQWWNGILGIDDGGDGVRDSIHEMFQVLTTASGDWLQASKIESEVFLYSSNEYADIFELVGDVRISQQSETITQIEGTLLGIAPPDYVIRYNDVDYVQVFTEIDLIRETTKFIANQKLIGSIETLEVTDLWATFEETGSSAGPDNYIARFTVPDDITSVPWNTDSAPWDTYKIYERSGGTALQHIIADRSSDALFFRDTASFYLYKTKLDGSGVVTSSIPFDGGIGLDRINKLVYVYNFSTGRIEEYDYDLNFVRAIYTKPGGTTNIGGLAMDNNSTFLVFAEQNILSGTDDIYYKYRISTFGQSQLVDITSLGISGFGALDAHIDTDEDKLFFASGTSIYSTSFTTGASISTILTPGAAAFCLNRKDKKIVYFDGNGDLYQANYDGSSPERVLDWPSAYEGGSVTLGQS